MVSHAVLPSPLVKKHEGLCWLIACYRFLGSFPVLEGCHLTSQPMCASKMPESRYPVYLSTPNGPYGLVFCHQFHDFVEVCFVSAWFTTRKMQWTYIWCSGPLALQSALQRNLAICMHINSVQAAGTSCFHR